MLVRELLAEERKNLQAGLCSREIFVMYRCQILPASTRDLSPLFWTSINPYDAFRLDVGRAGSISSHIHEASFGECRIHSTP